MKTKYRIITNRTFIADRYLQFASIQKHFVCLNNEREVWRYVPCSTNACVHGVYLKEQLCPTRLPSFKKSHFLNCFEGHEGYAIGGIIPFTKQYPDISKYFEHLRDLREKHLEEIRNRSKDGTITEL